jgi:hypothetical protein
MCSFFGYQHFIPVFAIFFNLLVFYDSCLDIGALYLEFRLTPSLKDQHDKTDKLYSTISIFFFVAEKAGPGRRCQ